MVHVVPYQKNTLLGVLTVERHLCIRFDAGLLSALHQAAHDDDVHVVVVTGQGKYFSSGADFQAFVGMMLPSSLVKVAAEFNREIFEAFIVFPKPIVVAMNGPAIGKSKNKWRPANKR